MVQLHCDNTDCDSWIQGSDAGELFTTVHHTDGETQHFCTLMCLTKQLHRALRIVAVPA